MTEKWSPVIDIAVGQIIMYGGSTSPSSSWLICNGASLLRSEYPELFAMIGTTFGAADGSHFSIPDLRDTFPIGKSGTKAIGVTGGVNSHNHSHSHTYGSFFANSGGSHSHNLNAHYHSVGNHGHSITVDSAGMNTSSNSAVGTNDYTAGSAKNTTQQSHYHSLSATHGHSAGSATTSNSGNNLNGDSSSTGTASHYHYIYQGTGSDATSNTTLAKYIPVHFLIRVYP